MWDGDLLPDAEGVSVAAIGIQAQHRSEVIFSGFKIEEDIMFLGGRASKIPRYLHQIASTGELLLVDISLRTERRGCLVNGNGAMISCDCPHQPLKILNIAPDLSRLHLIQPLLILNLVQIHILRKRRQEIEGNLKLDNQFLRLHINRTKLTYLIILIHLRLF